MNHRFIYFALFAMSIAYGCGINSKDTPRADAKPMIPTLHILDSRLFQVSDGKKQDLLVTLASIQGLMNRDSQGDGLYVLQNDAYDWVDEVRASAQNVVDWQGDWEGFVKGNLKKATDRYVAMDSYSMLGQRNGAMAQQAMAVAASYATAHDAIILPESLLDHKLFASCRMAFDSRGKDMYDLYDFFSGNKQLFNNDGIVVGSSAPSCNVDLALKKKWLMIRSEDPVLTGNFYSHIKSNSPRFGFNGPYYEEGQDIGLAAKYNLYTVPSANSTNISLRERTLPSGIDKIINSRDYRIDETPQKTHCVAIVMTDGGNLRYFEGKIRKDYENKSFGEFPMTFMMTLALKKYQPALHNWYIDNLPDNCALIAASSGLGYTYPSYFNEESRREYAREVNARLVDEGHSLYTIMDRVQDPQIETWETYMDMLGGMLEEMPAAKGVFFFDYAQAYTRWKGRSQYINGRPVISCRYSCWYPRDKPMDDPSNERSQRRVADQIKMLPKDLTDPASYSIVMFHANPSAIEPRPVVMDDIQTLVNYLQEDDRIELVNIPQLFELYSNHVENMQKEL